MKTKIRTLVIPDVHGRRFWKDAIERFPIEQFPKLRIIFLGDYLDPYEDEGISRRDAINNFLEICDTARKDKRIHLLIGNHDMHYFYNASYKSRVDHENYAEIAAYFQDEFDLFNVAFQETINGQKYLYTHAGVTSFWMKHLRFMGKLCVQRNKEYRIDRLGNKVKRLSDKQLPFAQMLKTMTADASKLNKMLHNFQGQANLWMCSWLRGGDHDCGSCIWADLEEWVYENSAINGIFQVFGHTMMGGGGKDKAVFSKKNHFAMLDSSKAWTINSQGNFNSLDGNENITLIDDNIVTFD